jgi:hypothetical protein
MFKTQERVFTNYMPFKTTRPMRLESNLKFLYFRLAIIFGGLTILIFITNKILKKTMNFEFESYEIILISICFCSFILFGLVNSIIVELKILKFQNVFGYTLKQISLTNIKNIKIIYKHPIFQDQYLYTIFRKDERDITIFLHLKNLEKYSFNGLILTKKGLNYFTKNKN